MNWEKTKENFSGLLWGIFYLAVCVIICLFFLSAAIASGTIGIVLNVILVVGMCGFGLWAIIWSRGMPGGGSGVLESMEKSHQRKIRDLKYIYKAEKKLAKQYPKMDAKERAQIDEARAVKAELEAEALGRPKSPSKTGGESIEKKED